MFKYKNKILKNDSRAVLTLYGRNALYLGLRSCKKKYTKQDMLVPNYSCGDEINAVTEAGYSVKSYGVKKDLSLNIDDIEKNIDENTAGILVTHFLGFYQRKIKSIKEICVKNDILLIEDCAHIAPSSSNEVGNMGDISIFSLRKILDMLHGGVLIINNDSIDTPQALCPDQRVVDVDKRIFSAFRNGSIKHGASISELISETTSATNLHGPRHDLFGGYNLAISSEAIRHLENKAHLLPKLIKRRIENFNYYLDFFKYNDPDKIYIDRLHKEDVPLFFPIIVDDSEKICESLRDRNIYQFRPFWTHDHKFFQFDLTSLWLKRNIIILPLLERIPRKILKTFLKFKQKNEY